jgi:hypothetical protein
MMRPEVLDTDRSKTLQDLTAEQATVAGAVPELVRVYEAHRDREREAVRDRSLAHTALEQARRRLAQLQAAIDDKVARL